MGDILLQDFRQKYNLNDFLLNLNLFYNKCATFNNGKDSIYLEKGIDTLNENLLKRREVLMHLNYEEFSYFSRAVQINDWIYEFLYH